MISIYWFPVKVRDVISGESFKAQPYGSSDPLRLLTAIENMPRQKPIKLEDAIWLAATEAHRIFSTQGGTETGDFLLNWLKWINSLGYHIELTGNEFEMRDLEKEPV